MADRALRRNSGKGEELPATRKILRTSLGTVTFKILPPFGPQVVGRRPVEGFLDWVSEPEEHKACFAALSAAFASKNRTLLRDYVYRGRRETDGTCVTNDSTHAACVTAGLWLGADLVSAAIFRVNALGQDGDPACKHVQIMYLATSAGRTKCGFGRLLTACILWAAARAGHQYATVMLLNEAVGAFWAKVGFAAPPTTAAGASGQQEMAAVAKVVAMSQRHAGRSVVWVARTAAHSAQMVAMATAVARAAVADRTAAAVQAAKEAKGRAAAKALAAEKARLAAEGAQKAAVKAVAEAEAEAQAILEEEEERMGAGGASAAGRATVVEVSALAGVLVAAIRIRPARAQAAADASAEPGLQHHHYTGDRAPGGSAAVPAEPAPASSQPRAIEGPVAGSCGGLGPSAAGAEDGRPYKRQRVEGGHLGANGQLHGEPTSGGCERQGEVAADVEQRDGRAVVGPGALLVCAGGGGGDGGGGGSGGGSSGNDCECPDGGSGRCGADSLAATGSSGLGTAVQEPAAPSGGGTATPPGASSVSVSREHAQQQQLQAALEAVKQLEEQVRSLKAERYEQQAQQQKAAQELQERVCSLEAERDEQQAQQQTATQELQERIRSLEEERAALTERNRQQEQQLVEVVAAKEWLSAESCALAAERDALGARLQQQDEQLVTVERRYGEQVRSLTAELDALLKRSREQEEQLAAGEVMRQQLSAEMRALVAERGALAEQVQQQVAGLQQQRQQADGLAESREGLVEMHKQQLAAAQAVNKQQQQQQQVQQLSAQVHMMQRARVAQAVAGQELTSHIIAALKLAGFMMNPELAAAQLQQSLAGAAAGQGPGAQRQQGTGSVGAAAAASSPAEALSRRVCREPVGFGGPVGGVSGAVCGNGNAGASGAAGGASGGRAAQEIAVGDSHTPVTEVPAAAVSTPPAVMATPAVVASPAVAAAASAAVASSLPLSPPYGSQAVTGMTPRPSATGKGDCPDQLCPSLSTEILGGAQGRPSGVCSGMRQGLCSAMQLYPALGEGWAPPK